MLPHVLCMKELQHFPYPNRWWNMIEKYSISILYTAPTAVRGLMRFGEAWPNRHDLSSLRLLGSVGEPINPEAWKWYHRVIGKGNCPIMDTWWQTETGMFIISPYPVTALKPGSAARPYFGVISRNSRCKRKGSTRWRRRLPCSDQDPGLR